MRCYISTCAVLLLAASPAIAAGLGEGSDQTTAPVSAGETITRTSSTPSPDRVAALQTTIEKRKAKKARDHAAYSRASAEANAMRAALSGRGPAPALRSVAAQDPRANGPRTPDGAVALGAGPPYGPMFFQAVGQGGQGYGQGTGGPPQCARPQ